MNFQRFSEWLHVGSHGAVHLQNGVPDRAYAREDDVPCASDMAAQVERETGLRVRVGSWHYSNGADGLEAELQVAADDFAEVLARLAVAAAQTYWDRYHMGLSDADTDYLDEAFADDFNTALARCGMGWSQVDTREHFDRYCSAVREVCAALAARIQ
jgi:hypothetical protein